MIAIIPARGGSKGLPGKNTRSLNGKPLITYTIEAALKANNISKVLVTTDSNEIALISKQCGADVPFLRPSYLAEDNSLAIDVYLHAFKYAKDNYKISGNKFVVLLPTTPLRDSVDIDDAITLFNKEKADTLVSVIEADTPPSWYLEKDDNNRVNSANLVKDLIMGNRQMNRTYYIPNGAIYILDYKILMESRSYYTDNTIPYIMRKEKSVDIDNLSDFKYAEYLIKSNIDI